VNLNAVAVIGKNCYLEKLPETSPVTVRVFIKLN